MAFKESIREARLKAGISMEKAGDAIFRSRGAIRGYEEGISTPNPEQLVILCRLFNTTPNELLGFQAKSEDAEMCKTEICKKTIKAIEVDVAAFYIELRNTPINNNEKRAQLRKSIIYAEKIIEDLVQKIINNN